MRIEPIFYGRNTQNYPATVVTSFRSLCHTQGRDKSRTEQTDENEKKSVGRPCFRGATRMVG